MHLHTFSIIILLRCLCLRRLLFSFLRHQRHIWAMKKKKKKARRNAQAAKQRRLLRNAQISPVSACWVSAELCSYAMRFCQIGQFHWKHYRTDTAAAADAVAASNTTGQQTLPLFLSFFLSFFLLLSVPHWESAVNYHQLISKWVKQCWWWW